MAVDTNNSETPLGHDVEHERQRLHVRADMLRRLAALEMGAIDPSNERALLGEMLVQAARSELMIGIVLDVLVEVNEAKIRENRLRARQVAQRRVEIEQERDRMRMQADEDSESRRSFSRLAASMGLALGKLVRDARVASTVSSVITAVLTASFMDGCPIHLPSSLP